MNLSKENMKKLLLLIAAGVLLNAVVQHLDLAARVLYLFLGLIAPFLAGAAIAFVINVPMRQVENRLFPELPPDKRPGRLRRAKRPISFVITLLLLGGLMAIVFFLILPEIGRTLQSFIDRQKSSFAIVLPNRHDYGCAAAAFWSRAIRPCLYRRKSPIIVYRHCIWNMMILPNRLYIRQKTLFAVISGIFVIMRPVPAAIFLTADID